MNNTETYISQFGDVAKLDREILLAEMDNVWIALGIDNTKKIAGQSELITKFYTHPVWALNGIFSELDPISRQHREAIASFISNVANSRIADFGGGSGVLARIMATHCPGSTIIEVIEPFSSEQTLANSFKNIFFLKNLTGEYDVTIAQDVLEHVDAPLDLALALVSATKMGGHVIFANSFYPEIKCHLPHTFYLRHTFKFLIKYAGLEFVGVINGAQHVQVFRRTTAIEKKKLICIDRAAKFFGPGLNLVIDTAKKIKREFIRK